MTTVQNRICTVCLEAKPLDRFAKHHKSRDGIATRCIQCTERKRRLSPNATHKLCTQCQTIQPVTEFSVLQSTPDKLYPYCNSCRKTVGQQYYNHEGGKEYSQKYYRDNLFDQRAKRMNIGSKQRGANGDIEAHDIYMQLAAQDFQCVFCGDALGEDFHIDHIIPLSRSGTNTADNIQMLCPLCNLGKQAISDEEYIAHCIKVARKHGA